MVWNRLRATAIAALAFVAAMVWVSARELTPPAPAPRDAPKDVFSAARAMDVVEAIARAPRPPGSDEHARVRDWILDAFRARGLEPEVQEAVVVRDPAADRGRRPSGPKRLHAARVENVVARLPGTGAPGRKSVALAAHHDSVATGPGAGDDAAGVAVLLETLRALRAGPPLERDVLFVVTDAEEVGLMGARAFVADHPAAADVGVVLNFEARGHRGPSVMFETSPGNGGLVRTFAAAAPRPVANSASAAVYDLMPNDTDLSVFLDAGTPGLNFAFFGGVSHYHTALDTPGNLDCGSLQQHGDAALAMTRTLAARDLDDEAFTRAPDRVYASVLGAFVWHHPAWLSWPILLAGVALLAFGVRLGVRRGRLTRRGLWLGARVPLLSAPLAAAATFAVQVALGVVPRAGHPPSPQALHDGAAAFPGILLLVASVHSLVVLRTRPDSKVDGLWGGALIVHAALGVVVTAFLPGMSVVFVWPLLFGAAGFTLLLLRPDRRSVGPVGFFVACVAVLPVFVIGVPLIGLLAEVVTLLGAFVVAAATVGFLSLLAPHVLFLTTVRKWALTIVCGLAAAGLLARAALIGGPGEGRPEWDSLVYVTDGASADWVSFDRDADAWTALQLGPSPTRGPREDLFPGYEEPVLSAPAPSLPLPPAALTVVGSRIEGAVRTMRLRCRLPAGASSFRLDVGKEHHVRLLSLAGRPADPPVHGEPLFPDDAPPRGLRLRFDAPPTTFELELALRTEGPVKVRTRVTKRGLPEIGVPRIAGFIERPNLPDRTMVVDEGEM